MAGVSTAIACLFGGTAGALWLATRPQEPQVITITNTPSATSTPAVPKPAMVSRAEWGALPINHEARNEKGFYDPDENVNGWRVYEGELATNYQTLVIHHSGFYEADDLSTMLEVQRFQREERNWADVAYHFLIGKSGVIYEGRDMHVRGAHVAGYNTGSLGICFLGNYMVDRLTEAQLVSANALIAWLNERVQPTHLASHVAFNSTTVCPGVFIVEMLEMLAQPVGLTVGTGGYIPPTEQQEACACCGCKSAI